ncbi:hypothetical protein ACOMHN_022727 [Nucella lapillus]
MTFTHHMTLSYIHHGDDPHLLSVKGAAVTGEALTCSVTITTSLADHVLSVLALEHTCVNSQPSSVSVSDTRFTEVWGHCREFFPPGPDFSSEGKSIKVTFVLCTTAANVGWRLDIVTRKKLPPGELEIRFVTPIVALSFHLAELFKVSAYIQTPRWDPEERVVYPHPFNTNLTIPIPFKHTFIVSSIHNDLRLAKENRTQHGREGISWRTLDKAMVYVSQDGLDFGSAIFVVSGSGHPSEKYGRGEVLLLEFKAFDPPAKIPYKIDQFDSSLREWSQQDGNDTEKNTGFRLAVSFYKDDLEKRYQSKEHPLWVCSTTQWPTLALHIACDLEQQCLDGRDELDCPYACHTNGFHLGPGSSCYFLNTSRLLTSVDRVNPDETQEDFSNRKSSWEDLAQRCREAPGRHLISLNTQAEWHRLELRLYRRRNILNELTIGLRHQARDSRLHYYRRTGLWEDQTVAYVPHLFITPPGPTTSCFSVRHIHYAGVRYPSPKSCVDLNDKTSYICEQRNDDTTTATGKKSVHLQLNESAANVAFLMKSSKVSLMQCPSRHYSHVSTACDVNSDCWASRSRRVVYRQESSAWGFPDWGTCQIPLSGQYLLPPSFVCEKGVEGVPYSMVCDHKQDCTDNSDEDFCVYLDCYQLNLFQCRNKQCIDPGWSCNSYVDCLDGSDEENCGLQNVLSPDQMLYPVHIDFDGTGAISYKPLGGESSSGCPETHFMCLAHDYCFPVYVRCNKVYDCPNYEDEDECSSYACPGMYRCRGSKACLHPSHVCDGWPQCPQHDDERFCGSTCPDQCSCFGLSFFCPLPFLVQRHPDVRYVEGQGSGMKPQDFNGRDLLIHLGLAKCDLFETGNVTMANLYSLDLTDNLIRVIKESLNMFVSMLLLSGFVILWTKKPSESDLILKKESHMEIGEGSFRVIHMAVFNSVCRIAVGPSTVLPTEGAFVIHQAVFIVVLPLSAALNPCLYLLTTVLQQKEQEQRERLLKMLLAKKKTYLHK